MTAFDLVFRGGLLVDGTGAPPRPADVGVLGDRILAVGDLSVVDVRDVETVIELDGRVIAPGFVDPHGHSDGSVLVDGALASHLHQGYTTQLSGNCGDTLAPITDIGREAVELELRPNQLVARWRTFGEYLDQVEAQRLGLNVAFLVGHGTVRASVLGADPRIPTPDELAAMVAAVDAAMEAGAVGLSTGLIYPPGMHAAASEVEALVTAATRHGGLYATHMRNECDDLFASLDESIAAIRAAGPGGRLQVSHLKCGSRSVWGRAGDAIARLEAARADGLDVASDQYPYTAASTSLATILPPALLGLGVEACAAALGDPDVRARVRAEMAHGISGWENVAADPGWEGIRIAFAASHPEWAGRSLATLADQLHSDPAELAFDALVDDRLDVSIVLDCMSDADVDAIMAVPWIAICTDAEGRRPGHPVLDAGIPHPRAYGSTARVLGLYGRERGILSLEMAVAKLTSVPAARLGLRDRGVVREGAMADLVTFDPTTVIDTATYLDPARYPLGISDVVVNGRPVVLGGAETGSVRVGSCGTSDMDVTIDRTGAVETTEHARLPGGPLDYTLRRSPRARTLRVLVHPERGVVVTIPATTRRGWGAPERHVESFLGEREPWLRRHLARQARDRADLAAWGGLQDGATLRYRGDLHRLRIETARPGVRRSSVERGGGIDEDELIVRLAATDRRTTATLLEAWFKPHARAAIEREIARHAAALRVTPTSIGIRDQRTRWGSASRKGRLSFSWRLILAPPEALETVVIHELAHLRVFGHGPSFWALVAARRPDHATWRRWLHDHSHELHSALEERADPD